jgi:hypothetical protein
MPLGRTRDPFSHPEWLFEIKWDGFRSLTYVHGSACRLISRNGNQFKSFPVLSGSLPAELRCRSVVLDGEIVCLDRHGKTQFKDLLFLFPRLRFVRQGVCGVCIRDLALPDYFAPPNDRTRLQSPESETGTKWGKTGSQVLTFE